MTSRLSKELQHEVFVTIKHNFSDFPLFDQLVEANLKIAIEESNDIEINYLSTKRVIERYYDVHSFRSAEQKNILRTINVIFKSCYVLILFYRKIDEPLFLSCVDDLVKEYPHFQGLDAAELSLLLKFRNMLKIALMVIPAKKNKQILLKIVGRLEGDQKDYITGGGQTKAVNRRVEIYEKEGGVHAEKKVERGLSFDCIVGIRFKQPLLDSEDDDAATQLTSESSSSSTSSCSRSKKRGSSTDIEERSPKKEKFSEAFQKDPNDFAFEGLELLKEEDCMIAEIDCDEFPTDHESITSSSASTDLTDSDSSRHGCESDARNLINKSTSVENKESGVAKSEPASFSNLESSGEALEWVEFLNLPPFLRTQVLEVDPDPLLSDREVSAMVYCDYLSSKIVKPPARVIRGESQDEEFKNECSSLHILS